MANLSSSDIEGDKDTELGSLDSGDHCEDNGSDSEEISST